MRPGEFDVKLRQTEKEALPIRESLSYTVAKPDERSAMSDIGKDTHLLGLTAQIVSAHVANNPVQPEALPALIQSVFKTLAGAGKEAPEPAKLEPAVPIKKSVFADHIVCLEDGKKLKMLKRHLATSYNMTPQQYRERWGLPHDYPMVAPDYAKHRSALAKEIGLGRKPAESDDSARGGRKAGTRGRKPRAAA
jgi:predicted transcriptional regulator